MPKIFKIDGQLYRMVERTTLANDFYVMKQIRSSGIADCTPRQNESGQCYSVRLLYAVVESGASFELLGGLLLPEGIQDNKWSIELAETTAAVLRQVTDPEDKAEIQRILIAILTDFFREGLRYLEPSPTASIAAAQPIEKEITEPPAARPSLKTSANGAKWYARWPIIRWIATAR